MCRHLSAAPLRIMTGYLPRWRAACHQELASPLERKVGAQAIALAREKGLNVIA
jgi:uncharacterized Fe-S radical SAM superfamily protein PflX